MDGPQVPELGLCLCDFGGKEFYQNSKFASDYNKKALINIYEALEWLNKRTLDRETRGVEGTHKL